MQCAVLINHRSFSSACILVLRFVSNFYQLFFLLPQPHRPYSTLPLAGGLGQTERMCFRASGARTNTAYHGELSKRPVDAQPLVDRMYRSVNYRFAGALTYS